MTATTYKVGDLAEWLFLHELRRLVLSFGQIDNVELERDALLVEDHGDALAASRACCRV